MKTIIIVLLFIFPLNLFAVTGNFDCSDSLKLCRTENNHYRLINLSLAKSVILYKRNEELYTKKISILETQNLDLAKNLESSRELSSVEKTGYFLLGLFAGGLVIYGVKKIY